MDAGTYVKPEREHLLENCRLNVERLTNFVDNHPETKFIFYYPPYSRLYWDELKVQNTTEDIKAIYDFAMEYIGRYDNVVMYNFQDEEFCNDLSIYRDVCHHNNEVNYYIYRVIMGKETTSGLF